MSLGFLQKIQSLNIIREWSNTGGVKNEPMIFEDDHRRFSQFNSKIIGKKWLDFGCGAGGVLRLGKNTAAEASGLEIQPGPRQYLNANGIKCFEDVSELPNNYYDLVTMFHVFEHLSNPIKVLKNLSAKLVSGGTLIIEIPHANDALLNLYNFDPFKDFTFWSEHLILHTRESISRFIQHCSDLNLNTIQGFQRYPLSNHLHWLAKSLPGGHEKWAFIDSPSLNEAYSKSLQSIDQTDTLIAYISKK